MRRPRSIEGITSRNVEQIARMENASINHRMWGEVIADVVARWVGSWTFLSIQSVLLVIWVVINAMRSNSWDPYPFILLNLMLSFQSAYATPIILMSANRQSKLDDRRNQLDLQINLLAEQENTEQLKLLRRICEKLQIALPKSEETAFEQVVQPEVIIRQIMKNAEGNKTPINPQGKHPLP